MNLKISIFAVGFHGEIILPVVKIGSYFYAMKHDFDRALLENGIPSNASIKLCTGQDVYKVEVWHQKTKITTIWT